jgi:hypothetical protein
VSTKIDKNSNQKMFVDFGCPTKVFPAMKIVHKDFCGWNIDLQWLFEETQHHDQ